jgi:excisionase family DNA binding protein
MRRQANSSEGVEKVTAEAPRAAGNRKANRGRRRPRRFTLRWWSVKYDVPLSTLYRAVEQGRLAARRPKGSSYLVQPASFKAWYEGEVDAADQFRPPALIEPQPPKPSRSVFQHVRWDHLPDDDGHR